MVYMPLHFAVPMTVHAITALMSIFACSVVLLTPVRVPMSVLLVVQVKVPNGEGRVTFVPVDRTVPFVVLPMRSTVMEPAASTTALPWEQLLHEESETGPLIAARVIFFSCFICVSPLGPASAGVGYAVAINSRRRPSQERLSDLNLGRAPLSAM
jgi:hypothetical protein